MASIVIIITTLMQGVFFIALKNVWFYGSDREIIMCISIWLLSSVISLVRLRKAIKVEGMTPLFDKIGSVFLCVMTLIPLSFGFWFVVLSFSVNGVDFK